MRPTHLSLRISKFMKAPIRTFCKSEIAIKSVKKWDIRQFGKLGLKIYIGMAIGGFAFWYILVSREYLSKELIIKKLEEHGYNPRKRISNIGEKYVNAALAYAIHFATNPIRIVLTCLIAGYITRRKGMSKLPMQIKPKLQFLGIYTSLWLVSGFMVHSLIKSKQLSLDQLLQSFKNDSIVHYYDRLSRKLGDKTLAQTLLLSVALEVFRLPICWTIFKFAIKK